MKTVNQNHPIFVEFLKSHQKLSYEELPADIKDQVDIDVDSDDKSEYREVMVHTYKAEGAGWFYVYEFDNGFVTPVSGMMGYELEIFDSLDKALETAFADWYPESGHGDFNDAVDQYLVGGEWLISLEKAK